MKKLLATMIMTAFFVSCSNSDEAKETNNNNELLFGTWKMQDRFYEGNSYNIDDCDRKSTLIIKTNGTYDTNNFRTINGECKADGGVSNVNFEVKNGRMIISFQDGEVKQAWINFPNENTFEFTEVVDEKDGIAGEFEGVKDVWVRSN
ncbi:Lipocalin-like domain-containing protein [Tenacibaculum sp. MAR_2009_124]|uniref:lipocalin family protein n=1 Tax=Tenacibaculum sp. MAR_2009_124 TaxID=1250059 RepID=UPI00089497C7|nr:lipocalin family protein [Tenacibaculum sp. MAR_2009_124]SED12133.1 Lipocalin-like domain-containing protein [Tenacibaculum sp. MAR_2009_124]